jgi:FAD/FMN-containing dehydrogenase
VGLKQDLVEIVGPEYVSDDSETLERYSKDYSFVQPRRPSCIAYPRNAEEVQRIVKYANECLIPVTPRSSGVSFYGAGIPSEGGIVVDLTQMNKILEIDARNKRVKVEPGVTWAQLQEELEKQGLMVCNPLLPHQSKSVLTSAMEREPILICKTEYSDTLLTAEVVLPDGELFWTGSALGKGMTGQISPDAMIPGARLWLGAQGTLGIMTWANIKAEYLPTMDKVFFIPFERIEDFIEPVYQIQRRMLGNECFILNEFDLASILADQWPDEFETLRETLPPWTLVLCLSGLHRLPLEKIEYEEEALKEVASRLHFQVSNTVSSIPGLEATILKLLRKPWPRDDYWKFLYKGSCHDIFFHTTLNRVPEFTDAIADVAAKYGYLTRDMGIYMQPLERARACFCQFSFHCDTEDTNEVALVGSLFLEASKRVVGMGGFFTTPYGPWADMVYSRAAGYTHALKVVKNAYDPNNILNPGKLCL